MSNKGLVTIYQGKGTGVLTRLDIVSYWYEIVSEYISSFYVNIVNTHVK